MRRVASLYVDAIIAFMRRDYPNDERRTMTGAEGRPMLRQLHPAFYGCYDRNSCIEMQGASPASCAWSLRR